MTIEEFAEQIRPAMVHGSPDKAFRAGRSSLAFLLAHSGEIGFTVYPWMMQTPYGTALIVIDPEVGESTVKIEDFGQSLLPHIKEKSEAEIRNVSLK